MCSGKVWCHAGGGPGEDMAIRVQISGDLACFTRPEMKVERVSYDVITPSAARGILEAIYWKPQIRWVIDRIHVLRSVRFTNLRRNEVGAKASAATARVAMKSGSGSLGLFVEEERQQRAATLLRDVAYVVEAHFDIVDGEDNPGKHLDQFNRRARRGQHFHQPYLGCREFPADVVLIDDDEPLPTASPGDFQELQGTHDLGYMLYDICYTPNKDGPVVDSHRQERLVAEACFFRAEMIDGVIDVAKLVREQGVVA